MFQYRLNKYFFREHSFIIYRFLRKLSHCMLCLYDRDFHYWIIPLYIIIHYTVQKIKVNLRYSQELSRWLNRIA